MIALEALGEGEAVAQMIVTTGTEPGTLMYKTAGMY